MPDTLSWCVTCLNYAPRPVVGLALQVGDAEKFPQALAFESLDLFFRVSMQGPCFTAIKEDEGDKGCWWFCPAISCLVWPLLPLLGHPDADFCWAGAILAQSRSQVLEAGHFL